MRLRVGFAPKPAAACLVECFILHAQLFLPIEEALDVVANHSDLEHVPLAGRDP